MTQILLKRVYEPAVPGDGYRVLVDRLWPRGIRKDALRLDAWAKAVAPSDELRRWYHADSVGRWSEFRQRYLDELARSGAIPQFLRDIAAHEIVTLLYAAKNADENHALILQAFLQSELMCVKVR